MRWSIISFYYFSYIMTENLEMQEYNEYETLGINILEEIQNTTITSYQELEQSEILQKKAQKARTSIEKVRKDLVAPYNDIVKQINAKAKEITAPIIEAETIIKERMLSFTAQEENPFLRLSMQLLYLESCVLLTKARSEK